MLIKNQRQKRFRRTPSAADATDFLCLATKSQQKGRLKPLGLSDFNPIEVEFAQDLRLGFAAGWAPSAQFRVRILGFMGYWVA
ncbi:MAG: hypothetical protein AAF446_10960 [Pseudomonadota bacterium]